MNSAGRSRAPRTTSPGKYTADIVAKDSNNVFYTKRMSIVVIGTPPKLPEVFPYGSVIDDCTVYVNCTKGINVINGGTGPFTWAASGLPPGMFIRTGSGTTCSGSRRVTWSCGARRRRSATYNVQLTVTDSTLPTPVTATNTFALHVSPMAQTDNLQNGTLGTAVFAENPGHRRHGVLHRVAGRLHAAGGPDREPDGHDGHGHADRERVSSAR